MRVRCAAPGCSSRAARLRPPPPRLRCKRTADAGSTSVLVDGRQPWRRRTDSAAAFGLVAPEAFCQPVACGFAVRAADAVPDVKAHWPKHQPAPQRRWPHFLERCCRRRCRRRRNGGCFDCGRGCSRRCLGRRRCCASGRGHRGGQEQEAAGAASFGQRRAPDFDVHDLERHWRAIGAFADDSANLKLHARRSSADPRRALRVFTRQRGSPFDREPLGLNRCRAFRPSKRVRGVPFRRFARKVPGALARRPPSPREVSLVGERREASASELPEQQHRPHRKLGQPSQPRLPRFVRQQGATNRESRPALQPSRSHAREKPGRQNRKPPGFGQARRPRLA
mmetsp:Transcript_22757/g.63539  ORF Transcript_22757/g.63539 Transcript_22757/m.63539 type:complete len:338 (-) Transcript_22757:310-1323(-)